MFKQLTRNDRAKIAKLKAYGYSLSEISKSIGKNKSTISREIKRNSAHFPEKNFSHWTAEAAQQFRNSRMQKANQKRRRKKLVTKLWVIEKLKSGWSPQQIAGRSDREAPEKLSHECIYQMIIDDKKAGGRLYRLLKRFQKKKSRTPSRVRKETCRNRIGIEKRPKAVDQLRRVGDLEADLIQGYKYGFVLTVVERKTQLVVLRKLSTKHSAVVAEELRKSFLKFKQVHTLTVDNGREFFGHNQLTKKTSVKVYFADPYCSTQRARVENMNGLIRYYLPRKTSFDNLTQKHLDIICDKLNSRPRKSLNFLTPNEACHKFLRNPRRCI